MEKGKVMIMKRTKEEIVKKIDELETAQWLLNMKDTWTGADYDKDRRLEVAIKELKAELETL